jgi:hypothetical protein
MVFPESPRAELTPAAWPTIIGLVSERSRTLRPSPSFSGLCVPMAAPLLITLRWLALAITVAGAIPVRICTCGASLHLHGLSLFDGRQNIPPLPAPTIPDESILTDHLQPLVEHDPDCHLVRPRPLMAPGILPIPTDTPDEVSPEMPAVEIISWDGLSIPDSVPFSLDSHPPPLRFSPIPLHLVLCQLRN